MAEQRESIEYTPGDAPPATREVRRRTYTVDDAQVRIEQAERDIRTALQAIRADLTEAQTDQDSITGSTTLADLRSLMRRMIGREKAALRRERQALRALRLADDDGAD